MNVRKELEEAQQHLQNALALVREPDAPVFRHQNDEDKKTLAIAPALPPGWLWESFEGRWCISNKKDNMAIWVSENTMILESSCEISKIPIRVLSVVLEKCHSPRKVNKI